MDASDANGVESGCISNTTTCSSWVDYETSIPWTLDSGDGSKTVHVWYKDYAGNVSSETTADLLLDTVAPVDGTVTVAFGNGVSVAHWHTHVGANESTSYGGYGVRAPDGMKNPAWYRYQLFARELGTFDDCQPLSEGDGRSTPPRCR